MKISGTQRHEEDQPRRLAEQMPGNTGLATSVPISPIFPPLLATLTAAAIRHQIGNDQRGDKQEQTENEEQEPAMSFATGNPSRPERQRHQDDQANDADPNPNS
jgi:hypothetical protein